MSEELKVAIEAAKIGGRVTLSKIIIEEAGGKSDYSMIKSSK